MVCVALLLLLAINCVISKESCNEVDPGLIEKIAKWSNSLPIFVNQDEKRLKNLVNFEPLDDLSEARDMFYR